MKKMVTRTLSLMLVLLMVMGVTTAFGASKTIAINKKNFPDATFLKYVKKFDKNKNGKLEDSEISKVKTIGLTGKRAISNLTGIEHFTALKELSVSGTSIKSLDLRKNTNLNSLWAYNLPLTKLNITGLKKLANVDITDTNLASVNVKGCTKLLNAVKCPYQIEDGIISWSAGQDEGFCIDTTTKVMNGKKLLRKYAQPKSIKFKKTEITLKEYDSYELADILTINPSTSVYPIAFSSKNEEIVELYGNGMIYACGKGKTTITAKCGKSKTTIKVTVK